MRETNPIPSGRDTPTIPAFLYSSGPIRYDCAKRTQFGLPPRAAEGERCKTNPIRRTNCAKRSQLPQSPPGEGCKTNPISRLRIADRLPPGRRIAQNEPNLAWQLGAAGGEMCKTNPISGSGPTGGIPSIPLFIGRMPMPQAGPTPTCGCPVSGPCPACRLVRRRL